MTSVGSILAFFMSSIFILALFGLINRGFQYARPQDIIQINGQLSTLQLQLQEVSGTISGVETRLSTVEGLSGRIAELERDLSLANARTQSAERTIAEIQGSLIDATSQLDQVAGDIDAAEIKIDALFTRTQRYQNFLNGLSELLSGLNQVP
jgi:chromosome segregation ATPase